MRNLIENDELEEIKNLILAHFYNEKTYIIDELRTKAFDFEDPLS